jgi:hypothetical protein
MALLSQKFKYSGGGDQIAGGVAVSQGLERSIKNNFHTGLS